MDVRAADDCACHELTLAALDRPGLLWRVCGVFALHGLSVLEARIFTDASGQALDTFRLVDAFEDAVPESKWDAVRRDLELVLAGRSGPRLPPGPQAATLRQEAVRRQVGPRN